MKQIRIADRKKFFLKIVIPTFMTAIMFIFLIFAVIIPYFNNSLIEAKKEMIKEIVNTASCVADKYYLDSKNGKMTIEEARKFAISSIESIRYGVDGKDYIWITDDTPIMIMHPYKKDLVGKNVADYKDPNGKAMFSEMVSVSKKSGSGYVDYMWQWMDDSTKIVPKISYIKHNVNWNWIIGTGVYIEDIRESINIAIYNLLLASLGIFLIVSFLLILMVKRNLNIERKNSLAEQYLKESTEKYKTLVEASYDGTLMFVDNKCIFANKKIKELIAPSLLFSLSSNLDNIIDKSFQEDLNTINNYLASSDESLSLDTKIVDKENNVVNALISFSKITFSGSEALIIIIKDLTSQSEKDKYDSIITEVLTNTSKQFNIGSFRTMPDRRGRLIAANRCFLDMIGYDSLEEISTIGMFNLFDDSQEYKDIISIRNIQGFVKDILCKIRKKDGSITYLLVSAVNVLDSDNNIQYIDCICIDQSRERKNEEQQENLLTLLINNASLWDLNIDSFPHKSIPYCASDITIEKALELMLFYSTDILLSKSESPELLYILTKQTILNKMSATDFSFDRNIDYCLQVPEDVLPFNSRAIDCIFNMCIKNCNYVLVKNSNDINIIHLNDLLTLFNSNINFLNRRLEQAKTLDEILEIQSQLPIYIKNYVKAGTDIGIITNTTTAVSDNITLSIIIQALNHCGQPPCQFAFIALGSEGRSERGLATDQDNAIIFEDVAELEMEKTKEYFQNFSTIINNLLDKAGYKLCIGEIMAKNPKWCQPLSVWKQYFNKWIQLPEPQSLMESSIFFDFRCLYGNKDLSDNLRDYINNSIKQTPSFLNQHAILTINYKLPVGMFGKIQTENKEEHANEFNLKNAIRLLVNLVRLYSMKHSITETNTILRLDYLYYMNHIPNSFHKEIKYCFKYLMDMQFKEQSNKYLKGAAIDNYLDLSTLNQTELSNLKTVLSSIASFQSKVKYDFAVSESM